MSCFSSDKVLAYWYNNKMTFTDCYLRQNLTILLKETLAYRHISEQRPTLMTWLDESFKKF